MLQLLSSVFQSLPEFKGKRRICKLILNLLVQNKSKEQKIRSKIGIFILPNLIESVSTEIFINGYYEKGLVEKLVQEIPMNGVF